MSAVKNTEPTANSKATAYGLIDFSYLCDMEALYLDNLLNVTRKDSCDSEGKSANECMKEYIELIESLA